MSVMEGSPVYEDRLQFAWVAMTGSIFYVGFLENKIV